MNNVVQIVNENAAEVTSSASCNDRRARSGQHRRPLAVLTGIRSDSHSWNLVYVQLKLEELGFDVVNLGANAAVKSVQLNVLQRDPALVVVSTVNGHGAIEGAEIAQALRAQNSKVALVIGGMLTTQPSEIVAATQALLDSGYNGVFSGANAWPEFVRYVSALTVVQEVQS